MLGLLAFATATAASALGAHALVRRLETGEVWTDAVLFLLLRLTIISAAVLTAGICGGLHPWGLGLAALAALAGLVASGEHRHRPRLPLLRSELVLAGVSGLVLLRLLLQCWFFSPHLGDATAYHLPKIAEWVAAGRFTREMGLHPHVTFPAGFELIETWWVVFLRHDVLIEMAGVEFVVLGFAATGALAKRAGLPDRAAALAGLVFVLSPGFHLNATSCLNDAPAAAMVAATAALVAARAPVWSWIVAAGLGLGIKPTYGFALPGLAVLAWVCRADGPPFPTKRAGVVVACGALVAGAWWYARNFLWFGNPFHPVGSAGVDDPVAVQFGPRMVSFWSTLRALVDVRMSDAGGVLGANVDGTAGWGAPAYSLGLLALPWAIRADATMRRVAAAFAVAMASSFFLVQFDAWSLKYVFYVPVALSLAVAWAWTEFPSLRWIAGAGLAVSFLTTMVPYDLPWQQVRALAGQPWRERTVAPRLKDAVPEDAVALMGDFRVRSYLFYRPDFSRRVVYLRPSSGAELVEGMRRHGVSALYATGTSAKESLLLHEALADGRLRKAGESVYRLP